MYIGLHAKSPLFLSDFAETNFLDRFSKKFSIPNFVKIRPVGIELFHAERRTDRHDEVTVDFRCLSGAPKIHGISLLFLTTGYATCPVSRTIGSGRAVDCVQRPSNALTTRDNLNMLTKVLHCGNATCCTANSTQSILRSSPVHQDVQLTLSYVTHSYWEHV